MRQKVGLNRLPIAYTAGGELSSHPTPSNVKRKRTVNMALTNGHQANPGTARNLHILQVTGVHQKNFTMIILGLGRQLTARIDSQ
jgi:hypothetical protein